MPTAKRPVKVVELPREVLLERLLPLLPACTLLRARTVCRCVSVRSRVSRGRTCKTTRAP